MIDITGTLNHEEKTLTGEKISLHKQLVGRLKRAILSGRLPSGTILSSSRSLASELGVSRNTVMLAYECLIAEGYLTANRRGTKVSELKIYNKVSDSITVEENPFILANRFEKLKNNNPQSILSTALLTPGLPSLEDFPLASWRRSLERAAKKIDRNALVNRNPLGEEALRKTIATHLHVSRGVECNADQIVITEGSQHALELCIKLITNSGETVWIENPCYNGIKSALDIGNLEIVPIPIDKEGINISHNLWITKCPKLIFTSPAHQYPTGAVLSVSRRLELITQARKFGSWIIEDDYDGDFRHFGSPIASMQGLMKNSPVIYIGSFSKTMYPTLRIGFMVLPKQITRKANLVLSKLIQNNNNIQQIALADFMISGEFGRHLGRMKRIYRERQKILRHSLIKNFKEDWILGGSGGMHLTLKLPVSLDDKNIVKKAQKLGINVHALSTFCYEYPPKQCGLVIGYGNTKKNQIVEAVNILAELVR